MGKYTPGVVARAPRDLQTPVEEKYGTDWGGIVREGFGAAKDMYDMHRGHKVREAIIDERQGPELGGALSRAATAGRQRQDGPTRSGAFDPATGTFNRPDISRAAPAGFNPDAPHPLEEAAPLGTQGIIPENNDSVAGKRFDNFERPSPADSVIDDYIADYGDTDAMVANRQAQQEEAARLAQSLGALREAGVSREDRGLYSAGVLEGDDVVERMDEQQIEAETEANNSMAFQLLSQMDPEAYPVQLPGVDYTKEYTELTGDTRIRDRQVELENLRHSNQVERKYIGESLRRSRPDTGGGADDERMEERRGAIRSQLGAPQTEAEQTALDMLAEGYTERDVEQMFHDALERQLEAEYGANLEPNHPARIQIDEAMMELDQYMQGYNRRRSLASEAPQPGGIVEDESTGKYF